MIRIMSMNAYQSNECQFEIDIEIVSTLQVNISIHLFEKNPEAFIPAACVRFRISRKSGINVR